ALPIYRGELRLDADPAAHTGYGQRRRGSLCENRGKYVRFQRRTGKGFGLPALYHCRAEELGERGLRLQCARCVVARYSGQSCCAEENRAGTVGSVLHWNVGYMILIEKGGVASHG